MTTFNISVPESIQEFLDAQVAKGGYGNAGENVCALLRDAQKTRSRATA